MNRSSAEFQITAQFNYDCPQSQLVTIRYSPYSDSLLHDAPAYLPPTDLNMRQLNCRESADAY